MNDELESMQLPMNHDKELIKMYCHMYWIYQSISVISRHFYSISIITTFQIYLLICKRENDALGLVKHSNIIISRVF